MNPGVLLSPKSARERTGIDFARPFLLEELTPLFHTAVYAELPAEVRLRYNQLHALYFNEQVAFFEQEMLSPALSAALRLPGLPVGMAGSLRTFYAEEQVHTAMFRALNARAAPQFYGPRRHYHFIRLSTPCRLLLRAIASQAYALPLMVLLALLQEERSLYYSKRCLKHDFPPERIAIEPAFRSCRVTVPVAVTESSPATATGTVTLQSKWLTKTRSVLEPYFLNLHRTHLADEAGHVGWDEQLLDWLWPRTSRAVRVVTAKLLPFMLGEYFHLPKRSGRNVVRQLAREFPDLDGSALNRAMTELGHSPSFLQTLYSPQIVPRSLERLTQHPEFELLACQLAGYAPFHPTTV